eukprot:tig00020830_g14463.t1
MGDHAHHCITCTDPIEVFSFGPCQHIDVCAVCSLRLRALYKDTRCPLCKVDLPAVVISSNSEKAFADYNVNPATVDPFYKAHFDDRAYYDRIKRMNETRCPTCDNHPSFPHVRALKGHMQSHHNLHYCDVCLEFKKVFLSEQKLYNKKDLDAHVKGSDDPKPRDASGAPGLRGHPACQFCRKHFYGTDELYHHMKENHHTCHICDRENIKWQYYRTYRDLELHFREAHFLCDEPECLEKKFVVFANEIDLQAHNVEVHKRKGRAAAIPVTFTVRRANRHGEGVDHGPDDPGYGRRRGRGRGGGDEPGDGQPGPSSAPVLLCGRPGPPGVDSAPASASSSSRAPRPRPRPASGPASSPWHHPPPARPGPAGRGAARPATAPATPPRAPAPAAAPAPAPAPAPALRRRPRLRSRPLPPAPRLRRRIKRRLLLQLPPPPHPPSPRPPPSSPPPPPRRPPCPPAPLPASASPRPPPPSASPRPPSPPRPGAGPRPDPAPGPALARPASASPTPPAGGAGAGRVALPPAPAESVEAAYASLQRAANVPQDPEETQRRNRLLVRAMRVLLGDDDAKFAEFKEVSADFRRDKTDAGQYYERFGRLFGSPAAPARPRSASPTSELSSIEHVFLELVALLPDPDKRDALLRVHAANVAAVAQAAAAAAAEAARAEAARAAAAAAAASSSASSSSAGKKAGAGAGAPPPAWAPARRPPGGGAGGGFPEPAGAGGGAEEEEEGNSGGGERGCWGARRRRGGREQMVTCPHCRLKLLPADYEGHEIRHLAWARDDPSSASPPPAPPPPPPPPPPRPRGAAVLLPAPLRGPRGPRGRVASPFSRAVALTEDEFPRLGGR